jgi:hypothetical protein
MTRVNIYRVDTVVQQYAKEPSSDFKKLQARYKRIIKSKRFTTAFPRYRDIELKPGRGGGSYADYSQWEIRLGGNRNEATLLHEIAHFVARRHPEFGYDDDHGPGFASAYLAVVKVTQGAEAEKALKHAYKALRVKVYKAGKKHGVAVRVRGEAPAKAAEAIAKVATSKTREADNRAVIRKALNAARADFDEQFVPCPEPGCHGDAKAKFTSWLGRGYGYNVTFEVHHEECGLHEYTKVRGDWWVARRSTRRVAAHN